MRKTRQDRPLKRRTTLTLPADSLTQAKRIARSRGVNLSAVVSEALAEGLRREAALERSEEVLSAYQRAFTGFSEAELAILDGVMLEPAGR
ncbi:MAG: type II toxin-antitoxin system CcdA family antitoxin [Bryobacteraceae bacterium]|nr:type II toxin-antitoxin system CcdA family antitoxin [Bryobacteraceae bacterium]